MFIKSSISEKNAAVYASYQYRQNCIAIEKLDKRWSHSDVVASLLRETNKKIIELFGVQNTSEDYTSHPLHERKIEKYTTWVEVLRLAYYHYSRFSNKRSSYSEGLFSTLVALAVEHCRNLNIESIAVLGCGPGRTVLDLALTFPSAQVIGLDYSLLSLIIAESIICGNKNFEFPVRNMSSYQNRSELVSITPFNLKNCSFVVGDLCEKQQIKADLVVCSNTLNLLPDHKKAVSIASEIVNSGGILIFADLTGWRLDRTYEQSILKNEESIQHSFNNNGIRILEQFVGGPYIEMSDAEQISFYKEHFFVGKKD